MNVEYFRCSLCYTSLYLVTKKILIKKEVVGQKNPRSGRTRMVFRDKVTASLLVNVVSSVGIIFVNKQLVFGKAGFHFGCILTIIHFLTTFGGCVACVQLGLAQPKKIRLRSVTMISFAFCGYVVFNNLSLLYNSITVYQMSKILCTPVIAALEYRKYRKSLSKSTLYSLALVCFGSMFTVGTDTSLSFAGILLCFLAIVSNSFYTVWGKSMQIDLKATPMQLLLYQSSMSALILSFSSPALDNFRDLFAFQFTATTLWCVGLSCILAFGVNFSFFVFVGKTSGLTMNVVGYLKTSLVFLVGFLMKTSEATFFNILGCSITLIGLALYTKSKVSHSIVDENK